MVNRLDRFFDAIRKADLSGFVLNPGASLTYLTGLQFHLMERPTIALFSAEGKVVLVLPELEQQKLAGLPFEAQVFPFGDDPASWGLVFSQALRSLNMQGGKLGVESIRLRVLELRYLESAAPSVKFIDGMPLLANLRILKEEKEISLMRQAAVIAQTALLETLKQIQVGMSERQISAELVIQLYRAGSDVELPFQPIVSTGPNTANPHAVPSDRLMQQGDLLLFDWGASKDGYFSDITRTFTVGSVDPQCLRIAEYVLAANTTGRTVTRPGLPVGLVDQAVRDVIEATGYGQYFIHRTGHGLGMEAHESPYIYSGNELTLEPGMVFTIEPGIYLPNRGGVRIEDDVVVTSDGLYSLTDLPREVVAFDSLKG